jgi:hypothetical protein
MEFCPRATVPDIGDLNFALDSCMDTFQDIDIKMEDMDSSDTLADFSMDHSLSLFEFDSMKDLTLDIDAVVRSAEKRSILDELDTKDKIRQDCMWSTGQNLSKLFKPDAKHDGAQPYTSVLSEEMSLTPPTSYINEYLKHFETPLPSDEDSSCSSGDEIDVVSDWSSVMMEQGCRLGEQADISSAVSSKDHSYTSRNLVSTLTPPESSEDEDSYQGYYVPKSTALEFKHRNRVHKSIETDRLNQAVKSIIDSKPQSSSKAKFTFKINIKTTSKSSNENRWKSSMKQFRKSDPPRLSILKPSENIERPKDARDLHNYMERQRRTELKNAYDIVKTCVPTISCSDRVSKQMILDKAIDFCRGLRQAESSANKQRRLLTDKNAVLKKKLKSLQTR